MNNIKVTHKILILVVISILAMIAVGLKGWTALNQADEDVKNLRDRNIEAIEYLGNLGENLQGVRGFYYSMLVDVERIAELTKKTNDQIKQFDTNLAGFEKVASTNKEASEKMGALKQDWGDYKKHTEAAMKLAIDGNLKGSLDLCCRNLNIRACW